MKKLLIGAALTASFVLVTVGPPSAKAAQSNLENIGTSNISQINLEGMDIESALLMVQQQRTKLLDEQLNHQILEVQKRNEQASQMNNVHLILKAMNDELGLILLNSQQSIDTSTLSDHLTELNAIYQSIGMDKLDLNFDSTQKEHLVNLKSKVEIELTKVKTYLDSISNSQQMDMLRLQSLSNKRNETFNTMTQFINKMNESRSKILENFH